ncbi:hypothetical protein ACBY01_13910 [Sphingomonas sp. ac-8]|uniref:hypothetical protein n=1 Tax=Sphingomonas sp. ac-8 TaxID=3242977 RepID=UPI003A802664
MKQVLWAMALLAAAPVGAEESTPVPENVRRLEGCWRGTGTVMDKPVTIVLVVHPVVLGAMIAVDADSVATADPDDRYAAHLLLGGGKDAAAVTGFWSDSFGGTMTATGSGTVRPGGFDIGYRYGDATFVNRWRANGDELGWEIVARDAAGKEQPFARYALTRAACPARDERD